MLLTPTLPKRMLLTLVCLLVSLHWCRILTLATGQPSPRVGYAVGASARGRGDSKTQIEDPKPFNLAGGDGERVDKFELMLLLRTYSIITRGYFELAASAKDWKTAVDVWEELAAISREFTEFTELGPDPQLAEFFSASGDFLKRHAEICADIKRRVETNNLTPAASNELFRRLVNRSRPSGGYKTTMLELIIVQSLLDMVAINDRERISRLAPVIKHFRERYGIELTAFGERAFKLPFRLPFEELKDEPGYLYETFLRDTDVSDFLKLHYSGDLVKLTGKIAIETAFNSYEIGIFYAELLQFGRRSTVFVDLVLNAVLDCADYNRRRTKQEYYSDAYGLHRQVHSLVVDGTGRVKTAVEFARKMISSSLGSKQLRAEDSGDLFGLAEEYLKQRSQLEAYAKKEETIAVAALRSFNRGESDILLLDREERDLARFGLSGRVRELLPGPCGANERIRQKQ